MNTGRLDRLAQLYTLRETIGDGGAPRRVFDAPKAVWLGLVRTGATLPADSQGGKRADVVTVFAAHYSDCFSEGSRLKVDGQTYEITAAVEAPPPSPRRQKMHLTCRALVGAQPTPTV